MAGDDETANFAQAPKETLPGQPAHLFGAVEKEDMPVADARINHLLHDGRKTRCFLSEAQAHRSEAEIAQSRFEVLKQSGFAGAFRSYDGSPITALLEVLQKTIPGTGLKPVADML